MPPSTTTSSSANATDSARTTTTSGTTPATSQAPPADGGPTTVFTVQPPTYTVHVLVVIQLNFSIILSLFFYLILVFEFDYSEFYCVIRQEKLITNFNLVEANYFVIYLTTPATQDRLR